MRLWILIVAFTSICFAFKQVEIKDINVKLLSRTGLFVITWSVVVGEKRVESWPYVNENKGFLLRQEVTVTQVRSKITLRRMFRFSVKNLTVTADVVLTFNMVNTFTRESQFVKKGLIKMENNFSYTVAPHNVSSTTAGIKKTTAPGKAKDWKVRIAFEESAHATTAVSRPAATKRHKTATTITSTTTEQITTTTILRTASGEPTEETKTTVKITTVVSKKHIKRNKSRFKVWGLIVNTFTRESRSVNKDFIKVNNNFSYTVAPHDVSSTTAGITKTTAPGKAKDWKIRIAYAVGTLSVLFLAMLFLCLILSARKKLRKIKQERFDSEDLIPVNTTQSVRDFEPASIAFKDFEQAWAVKHENTDQIFKQEYKHLPDYSAKNTFIVADRYPAKNRYRNVKPYDATRVTLCENTWENGFNSDYINASFVKGYYQERKFIATQGPLECTLGDFWHMVWQYRVRAIVMLVSLLENGRQKCCQYWPERQDVMCLYGDIQVRLESTKTHRDFLQRTFKICNRKDLVETRTVTQYSFSAWPDCGVPTTGSLGLVDLIEKLNRNHPPEHYPLVIHCSAGVGRTGSFITLDAMLEQLEREDLISPFAFIKSIRKDRTSLVQTLQQYIFIHRVVFDSVTSKQL